MKNTFNEGHILILSKQHYHDVDDLDEITASEIMKTSIVLAKLLKALFRPDGITKELLTEIREKLIKLVNQQLLR